MDVFPQGVDNVCVVRSGQGRIVSPVVAAGPAGATPPSFRGRSAATRLRRQAHEIFLRVSDRMAGAAWLILACVTA